MSISQDHEVWSWNANPTWICDRYDKAARATRDRRVSERACRAYAADLFPHFSYRKEQPCACKVCHTAECDAAEFDTHYALAADSKVTSKFLKYNLGLPYTMRIAGAAVVPFGHGDRSGRPLLDFVTTNAWPTDFRTLVIMDQNGVLVNRKRDGKMGVTFEVNPYISDILAAATQPGLALGIWSCGVMSGVAVDLFSAAYQDKIVFVFGGDMCSDEFPELSSASTEEVFLVRQWVRYSTLSLVSFSAFHVLSPISQACPTGRHITPESS